MSKKIKILIVVILAIIILVWVFSSKGEETEAPVTNGPLSTSLVTQTTTPGGTAATSASSNEFAALLSSVKSITIDDSIFTNPAYRALRDHPINIGTDIVGRTNPFAPVGTDGSDLSSAPTISTLQPGKVTSTSAEFSAQVTFASTAPVTVVFEYGQTDQFGSTTTPITLSKSGTAVVTVTGLAPTTTYRVRAVAVVGSTTTNGSTMTFATTTPPGTR